MEFEGIAFPSGENGGPISLSEAELCECVETKLPVRLECEGSAFGECELFLRDDGHLWVRGVLDADSELARTVYEDIKRGVLRGIAMEMSARHHPTTNTYDSIVLEAISICKNPKFACCMITKPM
jgi:hypothetical protein